MRQLIVSDFHLDPIDPSRYRAATEAIMRCPCDQLILAGDIFETWIGDDGATEFDFEFLQFCGVHSGDTLFIHGNRDFLITGDYLQSFGISLVEKIVGPDLIVIHGDELCTNDNDYQEFRNKVRTTSWADTFLNKPLVERQMIAKSLRQASRESQANRAESISDAVESEIQQWLQRFRSTLLIHGHTHRPAVHAYPFGLRCVTSDWGVSGIGVFVDTRDDVITVSLCHLSPDNITVTEQWERYAGTPEWKRNSSSVVSISV